MPDQKTDDSEPERERPDKPSEYTYRDYREEVEASATVALDAMEEYPEDFETLHDAIHYATEGDSRYTNYGHMLMTVLLSDQNPEAPDYSERWQAFTDLSNDPTWAECVSEMARVCYYSDVFAQATRLQAKRDHPEHANTDPDDCPTCAVEA